MKLFIRADLINIESGAKIFSYKDDVTSLVEVVSDGVSRDIFDWIEYIKDNCSNISDIILDQDEFVLVSVNDILNNPIVSFLNKNISEFLGFSVNSSYYYDNNIENGMNIFSDNIGYGRFILEEEIGYNMIGTDGNMFNPHTTTGGWTIDGRSFREKNELKMRFWKLETYGLTTRQASSAVEFSERLGENIDLVMRPTSYDVFNVLYFQFLAHEEYLQPDDMKGYYKVSFEVSERIRNEGLLTLNDNETLLTKNDNITFLER